jgi:hypothetical protein
VVVSLFDLLEVLGDLPLRLLWSNKRHDDRPARRRQIYRTAKGSKTERRERHRLFRRQHRGLNDND